MHTHGHFHIHTQQWSDDMAALQTQILRMASLACLIAALLPLQADSTTKNGRTPMKKAEVKQEAYAVTHDGKQVMLFTLTNGRGMSATITNYGGIVTSLSVPDKNGKADNIVLGFTDPAAYWDASYTDGCPYFGALIGRYGNRIARGRFTLDGKEYKLATNNGANHLHGGVKGFDKVVWNAKPLPTTAEGAALELTYTSADGEEGYPGTLTTRVVYTVTPKNELKIAYEASTDKKTIVNLTHHSYFNLKGEGSGDILGHVLAIDAEGYTPVSEDLIPTGEVAKVKGTPFDFRTPHAIGERISQVKGGYDHNFALTGKLNAMHHAARVEEPETGRVMEIETTEPGLQFYSGNFLDGKHKGPSGRAYALHNGFCLETQHYPDSPNHPNFPSTVLEPGKKYRTTTIYRFSVKK